MPVSFPHFCLIVNSPWCPGGNSGTSLSTRQNTCVRMSLVWVLEGLWHGAVVERDAVGPHVVASSGARPSWQIRTMALSGHPPHATYTTAQHNAPHSQHHGIPGTTGGRKWCWLGKKSVGWSWRAAKEGGGGVGCQGGPGSKKAQNPAGLQFFSQSWGKHLPICWPLLNNFFLFPNKAKHYTGCTTGPHNLNRGLNIAINRVPGRPKYRSLPFFTSCLMGFHSTLVPTSILAFVAFGISFT